MQVKVALGVFFEQVLTRADLNTVLGNRGRLPLELKPREASIAQWAALCCLMLSVCWLFHHLGRLFQVCEMQSNIAMYTLQALLEPLWWMTAYVQLHNPVYLCCLVPSLQTVALLKKFVEVNKAGK